MLIDCLSKHKSKHLYFASQVNPILLGIPGAL